MTFERVSRKAQASNAAIYAAGIIDPLEREANPCLLKRLARATGGESFEFSRRATSQDVGVVVADPARRFPSCARRGNRAGGKENEVR
jgi:hypothetical protein